MLSIIICTRDRAQEIANCLPLVAEQASQFSDVEVLVVDNGSTDNTSAVVSKIAIETSYPFRYIFEPVPGLCQARNRGRAEAKGRVLAFIDDDVILRENWVAGVQQHFLESVSDCLAGKVTAELATEPPFPMDDSMFWFFQATNFGSEKRFLSYPEHPIGCNMAFTTEVFDTVGGFDTSLKLYGDETEFFRRADEKSFTTVYDPEVEISQFIPVERLTVDEIRSKSYKWGKGSATVWMLSAPGVASRMSKIVEYLLRTLYVGGGSLVKKSFGRFYTFWYYVGYLSQLIKGLERE